jgi:hypothetical protein
MSSANPSRFSSLRQGRRPALAVLLAGSLAIVCFGVSSPVEASRNKLVEWVRRWLGNPPLAAGGTRGAGAPPPPQICLLHPWLLPKAFPPQADLAVPRPVLVATTPLRRILLINEEDGRLLGEASVPLSASRAGTWMAWPTHWPSLEPGREVELKLEAATSSSTESVSILLQTASEQDVAKARALQERLGRDSARWETTIQDLLTSGTPPSPSSRALAAHLLFSAQAPPSPALKQLRQALRRGACSLPSQAARAPGPQR